MQEIQERRSQNATRVQVESMVEICGQEPQSSAFEAESINVSARGMHLRTNYVPEKGQSLVCRFESQGRQIVVEGQVVWRRDASDGAGEFGVQFTALDGSSVDALSALCAPKSEDPKQAPVESAQPEMVERGTKVRLHIEGLAAPMKARVKGTTRSRVQVGSNLEFLSVGREIEVEALDDQANFSAFIDGVEVCIDPRTQVPQLLVTLRRPGVDQTPQPAVVDVKARSQGNRQQTTEHLDSSVSAEPISGEHEEALSARELSELGHRMGQWAMQAGVFAKGAGSKLLAVGGKAAGGMGHVLLAARSRMGKSAVEKNERPRRTAPPPESRFSGAPQLKTVARATSSKGLRQQTQTVAEAQSAWASAPPKLKLLAAVGGASLIVGITALITTRGGQEDASKVTTSAPALTQAPLAATAGGPVAATTAAPLPQKTAPAESDPKQGIVAEVPLFGPTPMATLEAAPPPVAVEEEPEVALNEGERELQLSRAAAQEDESFTDDAKDEKVVKPEDVKPFQRGALELPVVYKMKLDAPGGALLGTATATGFKITLPGRKVLDNGRAIEQRDRRILRVRTNNTQAGAEITFQFRGPVPGYKARLQKDRVDFFVSSGKDK